MALYAMMLCGNAVPTSPKALAERSELVVDAAITGVDRLHRGPAEPSVACYRAEVSRTL